MAAKKEDSVTASAPIQPADKAGVNVPDNAARVLYAADATLKGFQKEKAPTWNELADADREKYRVKAKAMAEPGFTFEKAHNKEYELKKAQGWKFGGIYDVDAKTDPSHVPYNEKPESERLKDAFVSSFVGQ